MWREAINLGLFVTFYGDYSVDANAEFSIMFLQDLFNLQWDPVNC
jgi:hypothetical protein